MKKIFYVSALAVALTVVTTGCSAPEPDNGLDINEPMVTDPSGSNEQDNPFTSRYLSSISGYNQSYDLNVENVVGSKLPGRVSVVKYYNGYNRVEETFSINYGENFTDYPVEITISTVENSEYTSTTMVSKVYDIVFEDGLLKNCKYSVESIDGNTPGELLGVERNISFAYNEAGRLKVIEVDEETFEQVWDEQGDLIKINSPFYGETALEYTGIRNLYGQWDPQLPFMGPLQIFGWFGKTSAHFPRVIKTKARVYGNDVNDSAETILLNYFIASTGVIDSMKAQSNTLLSEYGYYYSNF